MNNITIETNKKKANELRDYVCKNRLKKSIRKQIYTEIFRLDPPEEFLQWKVFCANLINCVPNLVNNNTVLIRPMKIKK